MTAQPQPKKRRPILFTALAAVFICCIFAVIVGNFLPEPAPTSPPPPTDEPLPTESPIPQPTLAPEKAFEQAIMELLGPSNRNVQRLVAITWSEPDGILDIQFTINDNFGNDLVLRGAMLDIIEILKYIDQNGAPYPYHEISFDGSFVLVDQYGNESEDRVLLASYTTETLDKINWDNFLTDNIFIIADGHFLHPAFNE